MVDYESKLAKHEYWEQNFELELKNFEDHGDDGEVWFGKDVQKKTVEYLMNRFEGQTGLKVLDVGTGNGALLFKLCKKGLPAQFVGIDYSE
jgi:ubiquinone/menaquinone biosynthesis C-methylase UbiE